MDLKIVCLVLPWFLGDGFGDLWDLKMGPFEAPTALSFFEGALMASFEGKPKGSHRFSPSFRGPQF